METIIKKFGSEAAKQRFENCPGDRTLWHLLLATERQQQQQMTRLLNGLAYRLASETDDFAVWDFHRTAASQQLRAITYVPHYPGDRERANHCTLKCWHHSYPQTEGSWITLVLPLAENRAPTFFEQQVVREVLSHLYNPENLTRRPL